MFHASKSCLQLFGFAAAIIVGSGLSGAVAVGQAAPAELSRDCSAYESISLPAEAEKVPVPKKAPGRASYRSYRGIGRPVNYAEARACAWQERRSQQADLGQNPKEPIAWVVGGSLILADLYFNGAGVKRDLPLAMHFACEFEEGAAELAVSVIEKREGQSRPHEPFELCDDAETTFTMNFCSGYASEIADDRRARYFKSLESSMTTEQKATYEKLLGAQKAYVEVHASEVDQGGTIRTMRTIGSQNILKDQFRVELVHFERGKWPNLTATQIASADAQMQRAYAMKLKNLHAQSKEEIDESGVTAENLSKVESAWETYRSAWGTFARLRYPAEADAICAAITFDRYRLLLTMGDD